MLSYIISIHAPRTGSDAAQISVHAQEFISIHAPRTGSDKASRYPMATDTEFQSTLPARGATVKATRQSTFQSTLPARGATMADAKAMMDAVISIHAPRTGSDAKLDGKMVAVCISIHAPRTGSDWRLTA